MPIPEPAPTDLELRRLMQAEWGEISASGEPLADIGRAAQLYGVVEDPYHRLAFAGRSRIAMLDICARGLIEERQWEKAARVIFRIDRMERQLARALPPVAAAPPSLHASRAAVRNPPTSEAQAAAAGLDALSDDDILRLLTAERRGRQRAQDGGTGKPVPPLEGASPPHAATTTDQAAAHPPFT